MTTTATATSPGIVHVLGIRHHGPGSARSLRRALEAIGPDAVLVEGPPDGDALLPLLGHADMRPPVALLVYRPEKPSDSAYFPFAEFSPEWQAISFALTAGVPVRFMDLPMVHQLGEPDAEPAEVGESIPTPPEIAPPDDAEAVLARRVRVDPLQVLAEAAGFGEGERWWEHVVEHRRDGADLFVAILEAMAAVRASVPQAEDLRELRREAFMRQTIRAAQAEGRLNIAVVCGAWHAPALAVECWPPAKEDAALLKGLPRAKVAATWVPWTHGRLAYESGYGAGIESPGWYHHLWTAPDQVVNRWLTRVGRLLRAEGLDASSASVIEAVRLAEALAALRGRPLPGLTELNEATRTVLCFGDETPMRLIRQKLIVGEALGAVPDETPMVPLEQDLCKLEKSLKLKRDPSQTTKVLDLREPTDLARSHLLHRLNLLDVPWGRAQNVGGMGTYKEGWQLQWRPEFAVSVIEASFWGTTVLDAATARAQNLADEARTLPELTRLLDRALLADLPAAVEPIMARLEAQAALASDVTQLMDALPPLAGQLRYSNVRQADAAALGHAVDGMVARIAINLPGACASLDDEAAASMFQSVLATDSALNLIQRPELLGLWHDTLRRLAGSESLHQLIAGRCCRILLDARALDEAEAARRMGLAVSPASDPKQAAAWVEGFLRGSGELLYYDDALFSLFDTWLGSLSAEAFPQLLPLLRRTFASFEAPLRRNLGEKARHGATAAPAAARRADPDAFDEARAAAVLPLVARLLGLPTGGE